MTASFIQNLNKAKIVIVIKACAVIYAIKTSTAISLHHYTHRMEYSLNLIKFLV